jgi:hypothetical protein
LQSKQGDPDPGSAAFQTWSGLLFCVGFHRLALNSPRIKRPSSAVQTRLVTQLQPSLRVALQKTKESEQPPPTQWDLAPLLKLEPSGDGDPTAAFKNKFEYMCRDSFKHPTFVGQVFGSFCCSDVSWLWNSQGMNALSALNPQNVFVIKFLFAFSVGVCVRAICVVLREKPLPGQPGFTK